MKIKNTRILVVEDDLLLLHYLKEFLSEDFDQVITASDGVSAYLSITEEKPDIILTDLHMPSFDGLEFITRIRADGINTPVILTSGEADRGHMKKALKLGVIDFIEKPYQDHDVRTAIFRVLELLTREAKLPEIISKFGENSIEAQKHQKFIGLIKAMNSKK